MEASYDSKQTRRRLQDVFLTWIINRIFGQIFMRSSSSVSTVSLHYCCLTMSVCSGVFTCVSGGSEFSSGSRAAAGLMSTGGVVSWTGGFSGVFTGTEGPSVRREGFCGGTGGASTSVFPAFTWWETTWTSDSESSTGS